VLARVASQDPGHLARVLDAGVAGIIVPGVESATEAANVVRAAYVPPRGHRSSGPSRASLLGQAADPLVLAMVETATGLDRAAEIAATRGVDGIFVGPYDLSLSIGAESVTDPTTLDAIGSTLASAREHDCLTGLFAGSRQLADLFGDIDLMAVDTDVSALRAGIRLLFDPDERN
jgi:2-keto-3-deoxy-L-rhamnonate aldolase RhmA